MGFSEVIASQDFIWHISVPCGLSDGEGCERFWSAIKGLIPSLRISGVYLLYTKVISALTFFQVSPMSFYD